MMIIVLILILLLSSSAAAGFYAYTLNEKGELRSLLGLSELDEVEDVEDIEEDVEDIEEDVEDDVDMPVIMPSVVDMDDGLPTPWRCSTDHGQFVPGRVTSYSKRTVECMSYDGVSCAWSDDLQTCKEHIKKPKGKIVPLSATAGGGWMSKVFSNKETQEPKQE
jgi:hypothetical protein